jgi:prickle
VTEEEDYGFSFVGKIFDRPLRTKAEECKFIYGDVFEDNFDIGAAATSEVVLDWAPPGVSSSLASKYLRSLPEGHVSIQGSEGAVRRKKQLEKQFPLHDIEPDHCHQLSQGEMESMSSYVDNVKQNIVGQGTLHELGIGRTISRHEDEYDEPPPPLPSSVPPSYDSTPPSEDRYSPPLPPPPMDLLDLESLSYSLPKVSPVTHSREEVYPDLNRDVISNGFSKQAYQPRPALSQGYQVHCTGPATDLTLQHVQSRARAGEQLYKCWTCAGCGQEMFPGEVAIFADRAGAEKCWHPSCFSCTRCGEMLEDLLYYHCKGKLYCGRDYAELMKIPRCAACDELIFSAEYTGAEDSFWHIKHFCCWLCDSPLAGQKYIPVEGQPHCLACWQVHHGKVCSACGDYIDPQGQRVSLGDKHWHASALCFRCGVCHASLLGGKMSKKHGTLLCSSKCGQILADRIFHQQLLEEEIPRSIYKVSDL